MSDERLIAAIEELTKKLDQVSAAVGRGAPSAGRTGQTGGKKPAHLQTPVEKAAEAISKEQNKLNKEGIKYRKDENKKMKEHNDALDDATDSQEDLTKATKDLESSYYSLDKNFMRFGKSLLAGSGNLNGALDSLSGNMKNSGTVFGKVIGGIAAGAGFMLGQMESFSKDASSLGGYADLGAFRVGSIRQAKLMSGLGDSFIKSLTQSNGGFKVFGATTQDAVENVSNLSRGFLTGSKYLNRAIRDNLGPELTKTVDETSKSIAAMGLSQEDVASVSGMLMSTIQFTAKSEKEAQQMLAKQFKDTVTSARSLSEAFGTSAQDMLKTMQEFSTSASGNLAALEGNAAAKEVYAQIKNLGIATSDAAAQKMALAMTEGNMGGVLINAKAGPSAQMAQQLMEAVQAGGGRESTGESINAELLKRSDAFNSLYENYAKQNPARYLTGEVGDMADTAARGAMMVKRLAEAQTQTAANVKRGTGPGAGTTEADNIKSMTVLNASMDSLRSSVNFLTASIIGLTGTIGALLVGGAIGGLLSGGKGFMGKLAEGIGGMFGSKTTGPAAGPKQDSAGKWRDAAGKFTKAPAGPNLPSPPGASAGMGGFGKWLEGMGSTGAMKGAGTLLILGGALVILATGLKVFNDVDWSSLIKGGLALGGLVVVANLLSAASTQILMGAGVVAILGAAVSLSAYGFKMFNDVDWASLLKGAVAIGALALGMNLLAPAVPGMLLGSVALLALGASMAVFAKGIEQFNNVKWEDLAKGTAALVALGLASIVLIPAIIPLALAAIPLMAFGAGLAVFAKGIEQFNKVEWDSVGKGATSLVALGLASVLLLPALIPMALAAIPLMAFGAALSIFADGIEKFNKVDWSSLGKGSLALVAFGAASILLLPALIPLALAAVPLLAFGAGLAVFALGIKQFNDVDWSSTFKGVVALGAMALAITGLAFLLPGIVMGSIALGIMAVAVGALGVALVPAAFAAKMFADSFKTIAEINGENLISIGAGLAAIGAGMLVFTAGMVAGTASSVLTGIMSLFGAKSPLERVMEFVPYADAISKIGDGILHFGQGIISINQGLKDLDTDALISFKDKLLEFAKAGSTNEVKLTADYLEKIGNSLEKINNLGDIKLPNMQDLTLPASGGLDITGGNTSNYSVFGNAGGSNSALTADTIAQVIAYLANIQSDLEAIRSNTHTSGSEAPVRLA